MAKRLHENAFDVRSSGPGTGTDRGNEMDYRFLSKVKVYFRDIDAMGHVNNAVYLSYLEIARMDLYDEMFGVDGFRRFPYILGEMRVRYLSPAKIKETLEIGIRPGRFGTKSFDFEYLIREQTTGRTICEATTVQVMFDYKSNATIEIPQAFRDAIMSWFCSA